MGQFIRFWYLSGVCKFFLNEHAELSSHVRIQRGGDRGPGPPMENHKNKGFLSNTGPDPLKITKLPSQHSMLGHHRPASKTPFKWRFTGMLMMAHLLWYLEKRKKNVKKDGPPPPPPPPPPWKNFGSAHASEARDINFAWSFLFFYTLCMPAANAQGDCTSCEVLPEH